MPVRLFVGNLPYDASEADVREFFSAVGPPVQVFLPVDRDTGRPRGFAFVEFAERDQAELAINRLNSQLFKGRTISVSEARARESRPPGTGGPGFSRPMGGGPPGRPPMGAPGPPGTNRPFRPAPSFGAPAPAFDEDSRRRRTKPSAGAQRPNRQEKEKGPIPIRGGGRLYSVDDDDVTGEEVTFDDVATSEPDEDEQA